HHLGADPHALADRLLAGADDANRVRVSLNPIPREVEIQRALILSLSEYEDSRLRPDVREKLLSWLRWQYGHHPDPGLHSAIDYLLYRWDRRTEGSSPSATGGWFVNQQGYTMAVIRPDSEFRMGSRRIELHHNPAEVQHFKSIPRTFAIGTKLVTCEQL